VFAPLIYVTAAVPLLIWGYLLVARGYFWHVSTRGRAVAHPPAARVLAILPARDEAPVIARAVASLAAQEFAGVLRILVIDDGSSDGTAEVALAAAREAGVLPRFAVLRATPPPEGWTGKLWAMAQGVAVAAEFAPDYFLFTDADTYHGASSVASLVAVAETEACDLVSHMVLLAVKTRAERLLIPAFVFFFFKLYPPAWVADPARRIAAAAGGCLLLRPAALRRAGGLGAIRSRIIDDCALAQRVKNAGGRLSLTLTRDTRSLRCYGSFCEIGAMISRTAFAQLGHSYGLLALTLVGLLVTYVLPVVFLFSGNLVLGSSGLVTLALMSFCYLPMVRYYRLAPGWSLALPVIACFYGAAVVHSAVRYARGSGGRWKGRVQDP
jgi:hopene-associated glycosyltransferase HpnB